MSKQRLMSHLSYSQMKLGEELNLFYISIERGNLQIWTSLNERYIPALPLARFSLSQIRS